jgi:hypothetical protein
MICRVKERVGRRRQPDAEHGFMEEIDEEVQALKATGSSKLCDPEAIYAIVFQAGRPRLTSFALA